MKIVSPAILLSAWLIIIHAGAQVSRPNKEPELLKVSKISGGIFFDGIPDEEVWKSIRDLPMVMHSPVFGDEPSEQSSMKIAYDDLYLYVSGFLYYQNPDEIRSIGKKRDQSIPTTDWFGIILDTFNDKKNAVSFWTNPNGVRTDGTVQNDMADPNNDVSFSWNTFWDVKTNISGQGWSAEFRIPLSSLRFQVENGKTLMGLTIIRYIPVKSEFITFPPIPPEFNSAFWKPSFTSTLEFTGLKPKKTVYLTPYVTTGIGQSNELNEPGTAWKMGSTPKFDAGLDFKYNLTNNLTLDLTANTDFAQVEADDQKINLTRYSLFFPEKRIFFQEKADVFDFSFLESNNLFYSRRIGLYDGNPVRIYGGVRLTGRVNKWDIGFLNMQTADYHENPSENFGVIRTKRSVFNQNSYIGGIITSRLGMNGDWNLAYGVDGVVKVTGDEYLTLRWAQTFENDVVHKMADMSPSRLMVNWEHRRLKGFGYEFLYSWSGDQFNPGIGFEVIDNYQMGRGTFRYGWFPEKSFLRFHKIAVTNYGLWNTAHNFHETTYSGISWYFEAKKGYSGSAFAIREVENLRDTLQLGNNQAYIPPGRYPFTFLTLQYSTAYGHALSAIFNADGGFFYDGWKISFKATPTLNLGSNFSLDLSYNFDYLNFSKRALHFTNHIIGIKGSMTLTTKTSLTAFVQYNTAVDKVFSNIRFRYNPGEGNDFWIVYDEGLNTDLLREIPHLPHTSNRTILLKYTYTFRL
jgi:hypothetical protein